MELSEIIDYVLRTHNNVNPNILRGMMIRYQASDDVRFIIVDELPEQGEEKVIYLVPAYDPTLGDIYEEYIWIDGAYELLGHERRITIDDALSETSENPVQNRVVTAALNEKQDTLVSGTNIKTINGQSIVGEGNVETPTYTPFKSTWRHDTVTHLLADINADTSIVAGQSFLGEVDHVTAIEGLFDGNAEILVNVMNGSGANKVIWCVVSSSNVEPYHWEATFVSGTISPKGWTAFVPTTRTVAGIDLKDNVTKVELQTALEDSTHRFVTDAEKTTWSGKQDVIADLAEIRSGAALGATSVQDVSNKQDVIPDLAEIRSGAALGATAVQDVSDKQDVITDLETIRAGAALGATAVQDVSDKVDTAINGSLGKALVFNESDGGGAKFENNDGTWSGIAVNDGGANGIAGQLYVINKDNTAEGCKLNLEKGKFTYIKNKATSARTAADELAVKGDVEGALATVAQTYALISETGNKIELSIDNTTYKFKATLKDKNNVVLSESEEIDLPLEQVVVDGRYDSTNKNLVLVLESGNEITIPVGALVDGLQSTIDANNKLSAEYVSGLATVATSGSYNDLTNKPTIPTTTGELINDASFATESYVGNAVSGKQDTLVSGTNIKTINNTSILGVGNIDTTPTLKTINNTSLIGAGNITVITDVSNKQDTLVSGTNIKTVNGTSLLGSGDIVTPSFTPTTIAGYDATKTQVLKHIQGVLTWVDSGEITQSGNEVTLP